jgi:putative addiction module component
MRAATFFFRGLVAHDLLVSLDGPGDPDGVEAWETEIASRLDDLQSGNVETVDADEVLRRIDSRLRQG